MAQHFSPSPLSDMNEDTRAYTHIFSVYSVIQTLFLFFQEGGERSAGGVGGGGEGGITKAASGCGAAGLRE